MSFRSARSSGNRNSVSETRRCLLRLGASDSCVPLVTVVLPVAALASCDVREAFDEFDAQQVLRVLVAELALDAQAQRRAVLDRQGLPVQSVGEDRLRVVGILHVDA